MPLRTGHSVEAQLAGQEVVGDLQLEITPSLPEIHPVSVKVYPLCTPSEDFSITIRSISGGTISIRCSLTDTIGSVKESVQSTWGIPLGHQNLIFSREYLDDDQTLSYYGVKDKETIYLFLGQWCACCARKAPITIAANGTVGQVIHTDAFPDNWAKTSTITIPVHILTTELFRQVTGKSAPSCPITMSTYAEAGLPFFNFKFPEEPRGILLRGGKSVNATDTDRRIANRRESKAKSKAPTIRPQDEGLAAESFVDQATIEDPDGLVNPDGPFRAFRMLRNLHHELRRDNKSNRNT
ncbi:hypothetical protein F4801DRAFT_560478 [Xylaria longipes]|nr:hypothetical protein F4801DRAFT_560478 [Xylaria longipes]